AMSGLCSAGQTSCSMPWIREGFEHPERADLPSGHHLRPIRADDVGIDYPAVMRSRDRLWAKYGEAWGWPPATMSFEADREDLAHHEAEIAAHETLTTRCSTPRKASCSAASTSTLRTNGPPRAPTPWCRG